MTAQQELKNLFWYQPESGVFRWRKEIRNGAIKPWSVAGCVDGDGYITIKFRQKGYRAHRLAWLYVHGEMPEHQIDHINGVRSDNRICNLRPATIKQNNENTTLRKDNSTGCRGVHFSKRDGKYVAKVEHNKKRVLVGYFENLEDAALAVQKKRQELYSHDEGRAIEAKLRSKNHG